MAVIALRVVTALLAAMAADPPAALAPGIAEVATEAGEAVVATTVAGVVAVTTAVAAGVEDIPRRVEAGTAADTRANW